MLYNNYYYDDTTNIYFLLQLIMLTLLVLIIMTMPRSRQKTRVFSLKTRGTPHTHKLDVFVKMNCLLEQ
jgi:hypothetical protein